MNYDQALEVSVDGDSTKKFRYVRTRNNHTLALGYCHLNNCKHDSKSAAEDCYKKYVLDKYILFEAGTLSRETKECNVIGCLERTDKITLISGFIKQYYLCNNHRNRDELEKLFSIRGVHTHS